MKTARTVLSLAFGLTLHYVGVRLTGMAPDPSSPSAYEGFVGVVELARLLPQWAAPLVPALILFIFTILGIVAQVIWTETDEGRSFSRSSILRSMRPLLVSPLVFYATLGVANQQPDPVIAGLMAFQNGFFWQAILQTGKPVGRTANQQ